MRTGTARGEGGEECSPLVVSEKQSEESVVAIVEVTSCRELVSGQSTAESRVVRNTELVL